MPMSHVRALLLASCLVHSAGCCEQSRENAKAFLRDSENQRCEVDADCVAVSTNCADIGGLCHQVAMSREAASSSEWAEIERELGACQVGKCTTCAAALEPACNAGLCSRP